MSLDSNHFGKLPPQAIDLEEGILSCCLLFTGAVDEVSFLKPDHFYKEAHQILFQAILEIDNPNILSVTQHLKSKDQLEMIGGGYFLVQITSRYMNSATLEYSARIVQQMFILREIIRVSGICIQKAYDPTTDCICLFDQFVKEIETVEQIFDPETSVNQIISGKHNESEFLEKARQGIKITGLTTGYTKLDEHFRFKPASFVIINGHDNVGKTFAILHLAVCANVIHGWKWILCCMENQEARIRQDLIQSRTARHISSLTQSEYDYWYNWASENFTILQITKELSAERLLRIASKINKTKPHQAFFIDPYNALDIDITDHWQSTHEFHYQVTNRMRNFIKQTGCCIYLSTHAISEALRRIHKDGTYAGFPMPPQKADVEGGGKFANRADDFLTIHRYTTHATDFNQTHIHVRKIKDTQTGGRPTVIDDPVVLKMIKGNFGLFDSDGKSPIYNISLSSQFPVKNTPPPITEDEPPF